MQAVTLWTTGRLWVCLRDLAVLGKAGITLFVVMTTVWGFIMAGGEARQWVFLWTLLGTALITAGAGALNQYFEREADARMERTRSRPIPAGRVLPWWVLAYGVGLSVSGVGLLGAVGLRPLVLALVAWTSYVFIYTPLKRLTWLCNVPGAVAGAIPPLIGWSAASGQVTSGGWSLFFILWLWQWPHLMTIAWMYREDMERAGFILLPGGEGTRYVLALSAWLLGLVGTLPFFIGMAGLLYLGAAVVLGAWLTYIGLAFARRPGWTAARRLFGASLLYLVGLCLVMVIDRLV